MISLKKEGNEVLFLFTWRFNSGDGSGEILGYKAYFKETQSCKVKLILAINFKSNLIWSEIKPDKKNRCGESGDIQHF